MDRLHSLSLLVALLAAGVGAVAGVVALGTRIRGRESPRPSVTAGVGAALGFASGLVSFLVHRRFGHGPASATPLGLAELVARHPAYLVVLATAAVGATGWIAGLRASRPGD